MTGRHTADSITSDALDHLYDERDRLAYEVQQWRSTYGEHALPDTLTRLHNAEAAITRARALADRWDRALTVDKPYARAVRVAIQQAAGPAATQAAEEQP